MKSVRWLYLVSGVLLVVLGIIMMFIPVESLVALSILICVALIVYGAIVFVAYFSFPKPFRSTWMLVVGILSFVLGIWVVASGDFDVFTVALSFIFAIWLLVSNLSMAVGAIDLKKLGLKYWGWLLAFGIIGAILGFVLLFSPVVSALTLSFTLAFIFLFRGISDIVFFFTTRSAGR